MSIKDAAPATVTVLTFEVDVTGAALHSSTNKPDVPLVTTPIEIEVKHLDTDSAFLSTVNVPADTYKSLSISLANTDLTILNSGPPFTAFGQTCGTGQVCEFKPGVPAVVTISSNPPFPLTIDSNAPVGLLVDVNLNNIISSTLGIDFTVPGGVTVTQVTTQQNGSGSLQKLDDVKGTVLSVDATNSQFVLHTAQGDRTIKVDSNTVFKDFEEGTPPCTANPQNFSCVKQGQTLELELTLMGSGTLLATKVELDSEEQNEEALEGIVVSTDSAHNKFVIVVTDDFSSLPGVAVGSPVNVSVQSGASFVVNQGDVTIDPALVNSFNGVGALLVGQEVRVRQRGGDGSAGNPIQTDRVVLGNTKVTGTVASVAASNFTLSGLPALFTGAGITTIQVQTTPQTELEGVGFTSVGQLAPGNTVSAKGLLFKTAGTPVLAAEKVVKR